MHRGLPLLLTCLLTATVHAQELLPHSLEHDGIQRSYHVLLPPRFDKETPAPLVLALHGGGGTATHFQAGTSAGTLTRAAADRGVVLVFPQGEDRKWNDGRPIHSGRKPALDDVGFISAVITQVIKAYGIDPQRVYATGISNGGFMSFRLAIDLSSRIAAVAPVTAQLSFALKDKHPEHPISLMVVNGTKDPLVPYEGGHVRLMTFGRSRGEILSTTDTIQYFVDHNACGSEGVTERLEDKNPQDGCRVEVQAHGGGKQDSEVVLVKVIGGGHTWPGGKQSLGKRTVGALCRDINASEMILDFFLRHRRTPAP